MLPMQGLTAQGPPHEIPPEASADYSHTGWEGGFERDHTEVYTYSAGDDVKIVIRLNEVFHEEPDEDLPEDDPNRWAVDKRYSTWRGECRLYGDPREEQTSELFQMGQSTRTDPSDHRREANVAFVYAENAIDSADEVILELLTKTPEAWFHAALTHRGAAWQGWTRSYQQVAGKVEAPIWI